MMKRREEVIDRAFGMFYGIGQLMPISSLWDKKFELPMSCLHFCLRNAGMAVQTPENERHDYPDFHSINSYVSGFPLPAGISDKQSDETRFAYAYFILLLCRLSIHKMNSFSAWKSCIDSLIHDASECGLFDAEIIQWFIDELKKENDSPDVIRNWKNLSPLGSLVGAVRLINTSWSWPHDTFGIRGIRDAFALNGIRISHLLEPGLFPIILGSIAGALIGRHTLAVCDDGCEMIGKQELHIAVEIGNMTATPGIVPAANEGFFTNILIVSDNPDDETSDMAAYLKLKYPNATIDTLTCQEGPIALLEELYARIADNSIDLIIGMRSAASVVCQMRGTAKILIFPEFHNIWPPYDGALDEESIFGGMTFKEQGLAYGVLAGYSKNDDVDSSLYRKHYRNGVRGYESGTVSSYLIDSLSYTIWDLCTPTVLPEYKPFPY